MPIRRVDLEADVPPTPPADGILLTAKLYRDLKLSWHLRLGPEVDKARLVAVATEWQYRGRRFRIAHRALTSFRVNVKRGMRGPADVEQEAADLLGALGAIADEARRLAQIEAEAAREGAAEEEVAR